MIPVFLELQEKVKSYLSDAELELLNRAYEFAEAAHKGQRRASGEEYILHPVEVARILANLKMDISTLVAALLHDTVEDTAASGEVLKEKFGDEVALLVDGVTKLSAISASKEKSPVPLSTTKSKADAQAENLRKIFIAMARDIRVILIKLADRLHNLRTLCSLSPDKQRFIAKETLEIYAPLTSRLGMWQLKWELEDLAFSFLEPDRFREVVETVSQKRQERERIIPEVLKALDEKLMEFNIKAHLEWRPKHFYSIYKKMENRGVGYDEIYDLIAVRVIVSTEEECYTALGAVHSLWIPLKDRIKDYIAVPKSNNYRSLHTTVYGPGNQPLEVQIRTWEMHRINDFGIAAHWAYKEGKREKRDINLFQQIYPWIKRMLDWQGDSMDAKEYIENLKLDLLQNQVFIFTPRGDVIDLPAGATSIDFAYRIHTDVGNRCVGAKVNTKIVPLEYKLQNADIVEIITSKHGTPSRDWLKLAKAGHTKNKIRQWFKRERRDENIIRGKEMLERELKKHRLENTMSDGALFQAIVKKMNFLAFEDLLASIGYGETHVTTVLMKLRDELPKDKAEEVLPTLKRVTTKKKKLGQAVVVKGIDNVLVRFSKCCTPVPGDEVFGFITLGKGVSVHRKDCPNFSSLAENPERFIDVTWDSGQSEPIYSVEIEVDAWDRSGLLGEIMAVINENKVPARSCKAWTRRNMALIKLGLDIANKEQLEFLMTKIRKVKSVTGVSRVTHLTNV